MDELLNKPFVIRNNRDRESATTFYAGVSLLLFLAALFCLSILFDLPDSVFPYQESGYYEEVERYPFSNTIEDISCVSKEGGSWAPIYQSALPMIFLAYFFFVLGRGGVVGSDRDVCFFSCLGSLCIIAYSLAWTITGTSTVVLLIRIALFVFVVLVLILILSALALFSYSTVGIDDRLSVLALIVYLRKLLKSRDP